MARIIQGALRRSPLEGALAQAANALFGDTLTPALNREKLTTLQRENDSVEALQSNALAQAGIEPGGQFDPSNAGQAAAAALADAFGAGLDPKDLAESQRYLNANMFGAEDERTTNAFVGAGGSFAATATGFGRDQDRRVEDSLRQSDDRRYGVDVSAATSRANAATAAAAQRYGYDLTDQRQREAAAAELVDVMRGGRLVVVPRSGVIPGEDFRPISQSDAQGALLMGALSGDVDPEAFGPRMAAGADMLPTESEVTGGELARFFAETTLSRPEGLALAGAEPRVAASYVGPDGRTFRSRDGMTDAATGGTLPDGAVPTRIEAPSRDGAGLQNATRADAERSAVAAEQFNAALTAVERVIETSPQVFGVEGAARRLARDATNVAGGVASLFGSSEGAQLESQVRSALADASTNGDASVVASLNDPALDEIALLERSLAYMLAKARDPGGRVTDADYRAALADVDFTRFAGSQEQARSKAEALRRLVGATAGVSRRVLDDGLGGASAAPDLSDDEGLLNLYAPVGR